jgi:hypothetical protein
VFEQRTYSRILPAYSRMLSHQNIDRISVDGYWHPEKSFFEIGFPYKKLIYSDVYNYSVYLQVYDTSIKTVTIDKIILELPGGEINLFDLEYIINYFNTISLDEILGFSGVQSIGFTINKNSLERNRFQINFFGINIPYKQVDELSTRINISVELESGEIIKHEVSTKFKRDNVKLIISPST